MRRPPYGEWLAEVAREEAERRREAGPRMVARRKVDAETATLSYQAWSAIADWLATGRCSYFNCWGGVADPPRTVIDWPLLEAAAAKELEAAEAKLPPDSADEALLRRRVALELIHLAVQREAAFIAETNALLRAAAEERVAA